MMIIALIIIGAIFFIIAYIWVFMIQKSPLRLISMVLRTALDRDRLVDPNAPIELPTEPHRAQTLIDQSQSLKESAMFPDAPITAQSVGSALSPVIPKALITDTTVHVADETTSDGGWPVRLDKATRQSPRPFLNIHLESDQDPQLDNQP